MPGIEGPEDVTLISKAGKGIGNLFKSPRAEAAKPEPSADHSFSYGVVYANDLAAPELEESAPKFPVGSILVRERLESLAATSPTMVIAMLKREPGFSKATGDWEFFMMNGNDMKLLSRQTTGSCAECHAKAKNTDWVFVDKLK